MTTENKKYLIGRLRMRPGAIHIHQELHSIVPSGEAMTNEQYTFFTQGYPPGFRQRNQPQPHARYITANRQVFVDDGRDVLFELTDRPPAKTKKSLAAEASLAQMQATDMSVAEARLASTVPAWMTGAPPPITPPSYYFTTTAPVMVADEVEEESEGEEEDAEE